MKDAIVIGGATGAWGDTSFAGQQLLSSARCDFIVFEALAEITMGILTRARSKHPSLGYATDIIEMIGRDIAAYQQQGARIITNAGGVNPKAAASRLAAMAQTTGTPIRIATVQGDDLMGQLDLLRDMGVREMSSGAALPEAPLSMNAYLGARPIAAALDAGADVVITGRCVDSALALGPLIHAFGWRPTDLDALSGGSLAGHLIECGPQATGGLLTDWQDLPSFEDIGCPLAECRADGSFVLTKPQGTGGLVDKRTVAEQLLYEIGNPAAYLLPDVSCDWRAVQLSQVGEDRVSVSGARGTPPPPTLKACAQVADGFKVKALLLLAGRDAVQKAERLAVNVLERADRVIAREDLAPLRASDIELLGAESTYGPHSRARETRELMLKIALHHDSRDALNKIVRELVSFGLAAVGVSGGGADLARTTPLLRLQSFLVPRELLRPVVDLAGETIDYSEPQIETAKPTSQGSSEATTCFDVDDPVAVPLVAIAHARSGDKGADANIGVRARHPDFIPLLRAQLTATAVATHFAHRSDGPVQRYELPGIDAFNFVLRDSLGGGGIASLRYDAQGKAYAQQLLDMPVEVPRSWLAHEAFRNPGAPST